jgi:hypothetical protein
MPAFLKLSIALFFTTMLFACKQQNSGSKIEVTGEFKSVDSTMAAYPNMFKSDSLKLVLYEVPFGNETQPIQLDSAYITRTKTNFKLSAEATKQSLYDVMIENGPMIPVINDDLINLEIDLVKKTRYYSVSGSPATHWEWLPDRSPQENMIPRSTRQ